MVSGTTAALVAVLVIVGTGGGYLIGTTSRGSTFTSTVAVTSTLTATSNVSDNSLTTSVNASTATMTSATAPCGSPGVYCGRPELSSASITVQGNYSVLQTTLSDVGNDYIGSVTIYVNGTVIGVPPASQFAPGNIIVNIQPGQNGVIVLTIPESVIRVQVGKAYEIMAYDWEGPPGQRASAGNSATIIVTAA